MFWTLITDISVAVMFSIAFPVLTIVILHIVEIISKKQKLRQEQPARPYYTSKTNWMSSGF